MKIFRLLAAAAGMGAVLEALMANDRTSKVISDAVPQGALRPGDNELAEARRIVEDLDQLHGMVADLQEVMVAVDATSEISVVDRPAVAAFLAGEAFLTRVLEAHLLCKSNGLSEVRFQGVPLQWGDDLFRDREQLPTVMGEVVVDGRGDFWFCDQRRNDNGKVETGHMSIIGLVAKVIDHQADRLVMLVEDSDAVHAFSWSRARFKVPGGHVIWSKSESGFWNNDMGWSSLDEATVFNRVERTDMALPMSSGNDATWMEAAAATDAAGVAAAAI